MFGIENYPAFVIAGILLNLTPGNDTMYILTRSITQGKRAGLYSVFGITTGAVIHTFFAALGLSAILSTSAIIFNAVKYAGVIYLCYLGLKMIFDRNQISVTADNISQTDNKKIYYQGILTNVLNPKVALFFLSFLPQFINVETVTTPLPFLFLGLTFITTGTIWCLILAYSASAISHKLRNNYKIESVMKKLSGLIFIVLGIKLAVSK